MQDMTNGTNIETESNTSTSYTSTQLGHELAAAREAYMGSTSTSGIQRKEFAAEVVAWHRAQHPLDAPIRVSGNYIYQLEVGRRRNPTLPVLRALCGVLSLDLAYMTSLVG